MKKLIIATYLIVVGMSACKKDLVTRYEELNQNQNSSKTIEKLSDVKVSDNFDWKTTKNIDLTLTGYANSLVEVISEDGTVLEKAMLKTNEPYITKINMPSANGKIYLKYMGQNIPLETSAKQVSYTFN